MFFCGLLVIKAQNITVTTKISHPDNWQSTLFKNIEYALEGSTITYKISANMSESYIDSVLSCKYVFDNIEYNTAFTLDNGSISIEDISITPDVGTHVFKFSLCYRDGTEKDSMTVESESIVLTISPKASVALSEESNTSDKPHLTYQGNIWTISVLEKKGGYAEGWQMEWIDENGNVISNELSCDLSGETSNDIVKRHYILHVTNVAPNDDKSVKTLWYDQYYYYYIWFYPIPTISFAGANPQHVLHGESVSMSVVIEQPSSTDLQNAYQLLCYWNNNTQPSNSFVFEANNPNTSGSVTADIQVKCLVKLADTNETKDMGTLSHTFVVWPKPSVTMTIKENDEETSYLLLQGESMIFSFEKYGGYDDGWQFEWINENGDVVSREMSYELSDLSSSTDIVKRHITIHVKNTGPEGQSSPVNSWFENTYHYYVWFYPLPSFSFADIYPENILDGEKIEMNVIMNSILTEEQLKDYEIKYSWNGINSLSYVFEGKNENVDGGISNTVSVECAIKSLNTGKDLKSTILSHKYVVWPIPMVSIDFKENSANNPQKLFQDKSQSLSLSVNGGYSNGWDITWKDEEGNILGHGLQCSVSCQSTDDIVKRQIILEVNNWVEERKAMWFEHVYNYYIYFYPCPIVQFSETYPTVIKSGDKVPMRLIIYDINGTRVNNNYNISCNWDDGKSYSDSYIFEAQNNNRNDSIKKTVSVSFTAELKGSDMPYSGILDYSFVIWPQPMIDAQGSNIGDRVGHGGQTLDFSIETCGGNKNGWRYEWYNQTTKQTISTSNQCHLLLNNNYNGEILTHEIIVRAVNQNDETVWFDDSRHFSLTIYPQPKLADEELTVFDVNRDGAYVTSGIREGNKVSLVCGECLGGNPNAWSYHWQINDATGENSRQTETVINTGYSNLSKDDSHFVEFVCMVDNKYDGIVWADSIYRKTIKVYNKPQTPLSIVKKGNGTSGTVIAMTNLSDRDLEGHEYYLVFGYLDSNGFMHDTEAQRQLCPGEVRWSTQITSSELNNPANTLYVYSLWRYEDNVEVTSGLRTTDSLNDDWDGSSYSGTVRAIIAQLMVPESILDTIDLSSHDINSVYSIHGLKVDYLKRGINIIKMNDGSIKKVLVK